METGTGKTYVYIKTIFELNEKYGWSKFIIVVPSIAIREGVYKSFSMMEDHFMDQYHKKARYFIYNSKKLSELDNFASSSDIQVMIINVQAFNARGADARRIDMVLDEFQSRKPIGVIKKTRPILILDEPQKMGGKATQESLKKFDLLFNMNFSATHREHHNLVYYLDALDAYNKKLVKKIQVKGFELNNSKGTSGYVYLQDIILSKNKPPVAKIKNQSSMDFEKAFKATKAIQDYVFTDGTAIKNVERKFVESLDSDDAVCVYAKLPRGFNIPTPVGKYSPDWAIAFNDNYGIKHIFFIAETKGTMESLNLRPIEQAKIMCAKKLFNDIESSNVRYHDVDSYDNLLSIIKSLK